MKTKKLHLALFFALCLAPCSIFAKKATAPKYVFLFIGDGMSYPQFQAAADYLGVKDNDTYMKAAPSVKSKQGAILQGHSPLNFMDFSVQGTAVTYDSCSFAPDSASTATSIATGHKTYSGSINVDETATKKYQTITEKVHSQLGYKVGIVSSVNLNHATPAAFYAHQASRSSYYAIEEELVNSGFEYFAGGGLLKPQAQGQEDLYEKAKKKGFSVAKTKQEADKITSCPAIIVDENLADSDSMAYDLDRKENMASLADYVKKGIALLGKDNKKGFFLMCEGGKIDWACHANDAASTIADTIALADAVEVAIDFAKTHKDETLILVTGDHETGGLTIGFAGTDYDTYLSFLKSQKISFAKYDADYVANYKKNKTDFESVLVDIENLFGLKAKGDSKDKMVLTDYEKDLLKTAYEKSVNQKDTGLQKQGEYIAYGTYEPLSVTITHILNNKAGVSFSSYSHTGLPVAVFAQGAGESAFGGFYDNTAIYTKLANLLAIR